MKIHVVLQALPSLQAQRDVYKRQVYSYGTEAACKALAAEASTPSLFKDNQITFINVLEGQGLEGTTLEIPVESFGIQTTDLGESDATSPSAVWDILIHQVDTK